MLVNQIPFRDFILTNNGEIEEQQIEMHRERVKTVGISLLDRQPGLFELELDWISAMNTETTEGDLDRAPRNDVRKVKESWDEVPDLINDETTGLEPSKRRERETNK